MDTDILLLEKAAMERWSDFLLPHFYPSKWGRREGDSFGRHLTLRVNIVEDCTKWTMTSFSWKKPPCSAGVMATRWGFVELYADEVTYFDTGTAQRINGRQALAREYKNREGKIFYDVMDFIEPGVQVCGDMAMLFYRFFSTWLNPDGSILKRTPWNCTEVYQRVQGSWKIIHNHWSHIQGERY